MKKNILLFSGTLLLSLVAAFGLAFGTQATAMSVGVSPGNIQNDQLLPGSTVQIPFTFFLSEQTEAMKVVVTTELPGFEDWVTFLPGKEIPYAVDQKSVVITAVVKVPENAAIKNYNGFIRVNAYSTGKPTVNNAVIAGSRLSLDLTLTTKQLENVSITAASIGKIEYNKDLALLLNVKNSGNVKAEFTKAVIAVTKDDGTAVTELSSTSIEAVDSFTSKEITVNFPHQLLPGQYNANLQVYKGTQVVFQQKLVINVAQSNDVVPNVRLFLDKNLLVVLSLLILAAVATIILVLRFYGSKPSKVAAAIALFSLLPTLGLIGYLGYLIGQYQQLDTMVNQSNAIAQVKSVTATPKLLGVSTAKAAAQPATPVNASAVNGFFKVYATADVTSKVVYYAKSSETLHAVEDIGDWYKVELEGGVFGYLPKGSVVSSK